MFNMDLSSGCSAPKNPGDIVFLGPNRGQEYVVVHISGDTAWVRNDLSQMLVEVSRLRLAQAQTVELDRAA